MSENKEMISEGISTEEAVATYFNEDALRESPIKLYRLETKEGRYYYEYDDNGRPRFYISVTTFIQDGLPTEYGLMKWIADTGWDESRRFAQERAYYGTFMHGEFTPLMLTGEYNLDTLPDRMFQYMQANRITENFMLNEDMLKSDVLAFAQFIIDYEVEPLAIEIVLPHPDGYAGAIDFVGMITITEKGEIDDVYKSGPKKGQKKIGDVKRRVRAIIDYKSGRKGFHSNHVVQLEAYLNMWNEHFPEFPVEKIYNFAPKDWRGSTPTYTLTDQTAKMDRELFNHALAISKIKRKSKNNRVIIKKGIIDTKKGLAENIQEMSLEDAIAERNKTKEPELPNEAILSPVDSIEALKTDKDSSFEFDALKTPENASDELYFFDVDFMNELNNKE